MKKTMSAVLAVFVALSFVACAKQTAPKAGQATGEAMLNLIPANVRGVFLVDMGRAAATPAAEWALKDEESQHQYQEFVTDLGFDPMKDVFYIAAGFSGEIGSSEPEGAVVINLKYDKEMLLAKLRNEAGDLREEVYNGVTIYKGGREDARPGRESQGAFLDASNIVIGNESAVKSVIDVFQKTSDSVKKSAEMGAVLKAVDTSALAWGAFAVPAEAVKAMSTENPMLSAFEGVTGLVMAFDYKNESVLFDLRTLGGTAEQNKQMADAVNGFKALGAMAAAQEPAVGELLGRIEITSGADFVRLRADIPKEVTDKLMEAAKSRLSGVAKIEK